MTESAPSIVIIAGEASGDLHGAHLAAEVRRILPSVNIRGVGGRGMREAGVELLYDSSSWGAIGVMEALKHAPGLLLVLCRLMARLKADPPDLAVLIDFGAFNVRLGRLLHTRGVKVLYYFPPSSWYRGATYSALRGFVDRVVTPFPWSAELLAKHGFQADFFGHPLLDVVKPSMTKDEFVNRFGFDSSQPIIGLLPGSRTQELAHNLPMMLTAAVGMLGSMPELQFAIPPAPSVNPFALADELSRVPWIEIEAHATKEEIPTDFAAASSKSLSRRIRSQARLDGVGSPKSPLRIKLLPGMTYDVLAHSRAAIVSSGTVTVEAMILGCPMTIMYRGNRIMTIEYKLFGKRIKFIGMPNIIMDRMICPEFAADAATSRRISESALKLIQDSPERAETLRDLAEARAVLGEPGAVKKTANVVAEMLKTS
jgi:lipid-A-disaccharide synthase